MKPKSLLSKIAITAGVFALSGSAVFTIRDIFQECKITNSLIGKALYKASSEDRILTVEEKARFIKDLGLEYAVQVGQKLSLNQRGQFTDVYLDSSYVSTLSRQDLKKYVGLQAEKYFLYNSNCILESSGNLHESQ